MLTMRHGCHLSYRNLGGGLIAIVTDRQLRRLEVLDNVQNGAPALAKEFVPFTMGLQIDSGFRDAGIAASSHAVLTHADEASWVPTGLTGI